MQPKGNMPLELWELVGSMLVRASDFCMKAIGVIQLLQSSRDSERKKKHHPLSVIYFKPTHLFHYSHFETEHDVNDCSLHGHAGPRQLTDVTKLTQVALSLTDVSVSSVQQLLDWLLIKKKKYSYKISD